ncbi:MAG TPA: hypothetical protein ENG16_02850 [Archaeoglobus sp.]|nr:hypothetical protein [Archaeoglobus sp.]
MRGRVHKKHSFEDFEHEKGLTIVYIKPSSNEGELGSLAGAEELKIEGDRAISEDGRKWVRALAIGDHKVIVSQNIEVEDHICKVKIRHLNQNGIVLKYEGEVLDVEVSCTDKDEDKIVGILTRLALYVYLIFTFSKKLEDAFKEISNVDSSVDEWCGYKLKEDFKDEDLKEIEEYLNKCGRAYSSVKANYNMIQTHFKNFEYALGDLCQMGEVMDENVSRVVEVRIHECKHKLDSAGVVYERLRDMKDLALGRIDLDVKRELKEVQGGVLNVLTHSYAMQLAGLVIEFFIVFAYSIKVWESLNAEAFEHSSLAVRVLAPLCVSFGVVAITKFLVFSRVGVRRWRWIILSVGILSLALGVWLMMGGWYA